MTKFKKLDKVSISIPAKKVLNQLLIENTEIESILKKASNKDEALYGMKSIVTEYFNNNPEAHKFYTNEISGRKAFEKLKWSDYAAITLADYINNAGRKFEDLNLNGKITGSNPIKFLWIAIKYGRGGATVDFFKDMLHLFRQLKGKSERTIPEIPQIEEWMERHPCGTDSEIAEIRKENRDRILKIIIRKIDKGELKSKKYTFDSTLSKEQKFLMALEWWNEKSFHLKFAIKSPDLLNEMLDGSLSPKTMRVLEHAKEAGIPFFVNPYYLSLLNVNDPEGKTGSDLAIRDYVIYSKELIDEFGSIVAWEKEDIVEPGKPNAAGWILPSLHNVHRRYPEVAILIPDTVGRACGGLCVSCQRMYDFQSGHLNFNLEKLKPKESWPSKLDRLMEYFEEDSQLRDVLITGGDALMSSDKSLEKILESVYIMAKKKKALNDTLPDGKKHAEILRIRLGSRLPVYLPQRVTPELIKILADFRDKASKIGIKQFVIQTHFESAMEITPESKKCIEMLLSAGWMITNQLVFTAAASRRGHTAKLRKALNDIGVLTYYTFTVKGYKENSHNFATNARACQEQLEEKILGTIHSTEYNDLIQLPSDAPNMVNKINEIRKKNNIPFLATDRNVMNLPGVGKSSTFRTIGISRDGRRILEFDHDHNRTHSPIINDLGKVIVIESKSISKYLRQLENMGEDVAEYNSIYGYTIGETEERMPIYEYPKYEYSLTKEMTNLELDNED
ncbi:MAG: KamA family radical SAM protein [Hyphomicrobiales bacterium]